MKIDPQTYMLQAKPGFGNLFLIVGIIALAISAIGLFTDSHQFYYSYLIAFVFWTTVGLGALFFTMLHNLVNATWSIVLRRLSENIMIVLPYMAILFIPILFGMGQLFHWSDPAIVTGDLLLEGKAPYLNIPFFIIRAVIYFVIWSGLAIAIYKLSIRQDVVYSEGDVKKTRTISAPGMILFSLTITFASFDWLMSLDAHWYSTIFGVYIFAGGLLSMLALLTIIVMCLRRQGILADVITEEHYHDLGKLLFAFTIFWGYMAFSQYFLIWYGNIPEETVWLIHRWEGSWSVATLTIVFGHFVVPFFALFPRFTKRSPLMLSLVSFWLLLMHWVDLYWIVMPNLHHHGIHLSWLDATTLIGIGGVFIWLFIRNLKSKAIVPINDPGLDESIKFNNI